MSDIWILLKGGRYYYNQKKHERASGEYASSKSISRGVGFRLTLIEVIPNAAN